ncbi:MAG: ABC transporter ATP-binding protein [Candidatus Krumholzibacteriota bacterium]|nr:ABC transporter ATP-binding protein [Candidatus Krumholzibacteriota bacterium]
MLEVIGLSKKLGDFRLNDISFDVASGEYFVLLGASGTGKTVLLETLTGIITSDRGRIILEGADITDEKIQKRKIAIVFQDQALFPHMTVRKNIAYGLSDRRISRARKNDRVNELARSMGIESLLDRMPSTLSGGEAQRVALARALALDPECILLDEPLSSLDNNTRRKIRVLLRRLNREGITIIHVTHDYEEAVSLAERIGVMEKGSIIQVDTPENILHHPRSEFVAGFVGIKNFFRGKIVRGRNNGRDHSEFLTGGTRFSVKADIPEGECFALIRGEDIALSPVRPSSLSDNLMRGVVSDISKVRSGIEVVIESEVEISAVAADGLQKKTGIEIGSEVYLSFEPGAVRILEV